MYYVIHYTYSIIIFHIIVPDSVGGYSLFVIVPESVGGKSIFVLFVFVCLSVCLTFSSAMLEHRNVYFGNLPRYGQPPKSIEFQPDQTMAIRLISLMSKLLKGPISLKWYQIFLQLLLTLDRK